MDFTAGTSEVLVVVESLPESKQRLGAGLGTGIEQNADFRVQDATNGSEQPSVRVDLLGVLLLQTEHHLDGRKSAGAVVVGTDELLVGCNRQLSGVLKLGFVRNGQKSLFAGGLQCEQPSRCRQCPSS